MRQGTDPSSGAVADEFESALSVTYRVTALDRLRETFPDRYTLLTRLGVLSSLVAAS